MTNSTRCLYNSSIKDFILKDDNSIFGVLCDNYHGDALTTTREAWKGEIFIPLLSLSLKNFLRKDKGYFIDLITYAFQNKIELLFLWKKVDLRQGLMFEKTT